MTEQENKKEESFVSHKEFKKQKNIYSFVSVVFIVSLFLCLISLNMLNKNMSNMLEYNKSLQTRIYNNEKAMQEMQTVLINKEKEVHNTLLAISDLLLEQQKTISENELMFDKINKQLMEQENKINSLMKNKDYTSKETFGLENNKEKVAVFFNLAKI